MFIVLSIQNPRYHETHNNIVPTTPYPRPPVTITLIFYLFPVDTLTNIIFIYLFNIIGVYSTGKTLIIQDFFLCGKRQLPTTTCNSSVIDFSWFFIVSLFSINIFLNPDLKQRRGLTEMLTKYTIEIKWTHLHIPLSHFLLCT